MGRHWTLTLVLLFLFSGGCRQDVSSVPTTPSQPGDHVTFSITNKKYSRVWGYHKVLGDGTLIAAFSGHRPEQWPMPPEQWKEIWGLAETVLADVAEGTYSLGQDGGAIPEFFTIEIVNAGRRKIFRLSESGNEPEVPDSLGHLCAAMSGLTAW